jgi:hypothetical protein
MTCRLLDGALFETVDSAVLFSPLLLPRCRDAQFLAWPQAFPQGWNFHSPHPQHPARVCVQCVPEPSRLRRSLVLSKFGINIANTGFVATVDLQAK